MIFQDYRLFPHLTVEKNIQFGYKRRSSSSRSIDYANLIEMLELQNLLTRYPRHLSGGEQQRTAIARAVAMCPDLILMDEPFSSLNDALKDSVLIYLKRIVDEWKVPAIIVSHDWNDIARFSDWFLLLSGGKIIDQGIPNPEIKNRALLV